MADLLLVDAKPAPGAALPGGNGLAFDWRLLVGRRFLKPWMLAGGLTPDNVAEAIRLTGAPKRDAILRLPGSATMTGTLSRPDIVVPPEVKSVGNVFKALGRAITGRQGPVAQDADCEELSARVLR